MMKKNAIMCSILIALFGLLSAAQDAFAVDPPHNGQNSMNMPIACSTCHYDSALPPPTWATDPTTTDNTYFNNLCRSCHNSGTVTPDYVVKTHSSQNTSGKYLTWTVECRVCHNPHYQDQISSYPTDTTSNLFAGSIFSYIQAAPTATTSTINVTATGLVPNMWIDYMLVPNTLYPTKMYRILTNTANSFTVIGSINGRYALPGSAFGVRLSSMLLAQLRTPLGAVETVKFFTADSSKPNSYASSTSSANVTGICQVCHTQTHSFNRWGVLGSDPSIQEGPTHPAGVVATGQKCTQCHIHTEGFKGACNSCHGSPPIDAATLISKDKLGNTVTSDSPGPGAHNTHVNSLGYNCATCHTGGMLGGQLEGDYKINIGFYLIGNLGGNYDGKSGRSVYTYATGTGSTTSVTSGGSLRCTNLYCHSSGQGSTSNNPTPGYSSPSWTNPASGACGTCHQTKAGTALGAITSGSHTTHIAVSGTGCDDCHTGAAADASSYSAPAHVNKSIDVANNYSAGGVPGNGYGTCSAATCHASPYGPVSVVTPTWGTVAGCIACHTVPIAATGPNTGGHALHNDTICVDCHNAGTTSTQEPSTGHRDGNIDIANVGYPLNVAKHAAGSGYATCSTASCHANVYGSGTVTTPVWGTSGNGCVACHSIPIAATGPNTGSHAEHNDTTCTDCHNAGTTSTSAPSTGHRDGNIDVNNGYPASVAKHAAGSYTGTCSTASCHANVYGTGTMTTPVWGAVANCSACHTVPIAATGPNTGSHAQHGYTNCTLCHNAGTTSTTKPSIGHADNNIDVVNVGYPPNVAKHLAGSGYSSCSAAICHGTLSPVWGANTVSAQCVKCHGVALTSTASYSANRDLAAPGYNGTGRDTSGSNGNPTSGGVSPDPQVGAHDTHLQGLGSYKTNGIACTDCHAVTSLNDSGHMNGSTTFVWSSLATLSGALTPSYNQATRQCSNVYCHGAAMKYPADQGTDITPLWTDGAYLTTNATTMNASDCNKCHLSPAINSSYDHQNINLVPNACNSCHGHDGFGLTHIDGILQAQGGACDSCHSYDVDAFGDWGSSPKAVEGWGAHATHIRHLKSVNSVSLSASANAFGGAVYAQVCGVCHTLDVNLHSMSSQTNIRHITFSDGNLAYQFTVSSGSPTYRGITGQPSSAFPKTCSNISCHFQQSPVWEGY
jgi:predicted CxxxxCH...CXXCH cytochrome family protein